MLSHAHGHMESDENEEGGESLLQRRSPCVPRRHKKSPMPRDTETEGLLQAGPNALTVHSIPLNQLYSELQTSAEGLRTDTSREIRARVGYNKVPPPLSAPAWLCCLLPCLLRTKAMMEYNEVVPE